MVSFPVIQEACRAFDIASPISLVRISLVLYRSIDEIHDEIPIAGRLGMETANVSHEQCAEYGATLRFAMDCGLHPQLSLNSSSWTARLGERIRSTLLRRASAYKRRQSHQPHLWRYLFCLRVGYWRGSHDESKAHVAMEVCRLIVGDRIHCCRCY